MLEEFDKQMKQMEPLLNFDLIVFYDFCASLLQDFDYNYRPGTRRLPDDFERKCFDFADGLLWNVADTVHSAKPRTPEELTAVVQGTNFGRVIHTMNGVIECSANLYTKKAF